MKKNYLCTKKQKASNLWLNALVIARSTEIPPSDSTQIMSLGGNIGHSSHDKYIRDFDKNKKLSLKLHDTATGQVVIKYELIDV